MGLKKEWAFVRLNKVYASGSCNEKEYNEICHHINNGHTFMAFKAYQTINTKGDKR